MDDLKPLYTITWSKPYFPYMHPKMPVSFRLWYLPAWNFAVCPWVFSECPMAVSISIVPYDKFPLPLPIPVWYRLLIPPHQPEYVPQLLPSWQEPVKIVCFQICPEAENPLYWKYHQTRIAVACLTQTYHTWYDNFPSVCSGMTLFLQYFLHLQLRSFLTSQ